MRKNFLFSIVTFVLIGSLLTGCSAKQPSEALCSESVYYDYTEEYPAIESMDSASFYYDSTNSAEYYLIPEGDFNTEEYSAIDENGFKKVSMSPLSTFSADVDTASYSNMRRFILDGYGPDEIPEGAIRTEELINYFNYDYNNPGEGEPFGVTKTISKCPWNENHELVTIGLKTEDIDFSESADSNIVFLIDVSGSMYSDDKLPLLVKSFTKMLDELGEKDRVSIVTYASGDRIVLEGVPASEKETIVNALESLEAGGGTNGGQGIISAYNLCEEYFIEGGNNRVILATDGDMNIGQTSDSQLKELIEKESETGIFLTVLGFGTGNYSDTRLETLADYGNGNYAYIDSMKEAKKVLCEELGANMVTVAKDVKFQVEFNPAVVSEYKLIGYENRLLNDEDFEDDTKDAGEIGAGHRVTAMYEIIPVGEDSENDDNLKYQDTKLTEEALESDEWMTLSVRYKEPAENTSKELEYVIGNKDYTDTPSEDFVFAAAVAEFSQLLREENTVPSDVTFRDVQNLLKSVSDKDEYKQEFEDLVTMIAYRSDNMDSDYPVEYTE